MLIDAKRAHWQAIIQRDVFIDLPEGDQLEGHVGQLRKCLYGTRDASAEWHKRWLAVLENLSFQPGVFSPCVLWHPEKLIAVFVHGDDFLCVGEVPDLEWTYEALRKEIWCEKQGILGPKSEGLCSTLTVLNRILTHEEETGDILYEADPRHVALVLRDLGLEHAKGVSSPAVKVQEADEEAVIEGSAARVFRSVTMRLNFLSADRPDIQFGTKEAARHMANPTRSAMTKVKRIGRYLKKHPRLVQRFAKQSEVFQFTVESDSDYAGCVATRKSTSSTYLYHGKHLLRSSSTTQKVPSLSSAEAELYALVKAASIGLGAKMVAKDLGLQYGLVVHADSSAALAIAKRRGVGKIRHLAAPSAWLQAKVAAKELVVKKIDGKQNTADMGTKALPGSSIINFLTKMNFVCMQGRSAAAKALNKS